MPTSFWTEIRLHYMSVVNLVRVVDKYLNEIVMIAVCNNIIVIGAQMRYLVRWVVFVLSKQYLYLRFCVLITEKNSI